MTARRDPHALAEAVRAACLAAALEAYDDAGLRGLCGEGRLEVALDAIRGLDLAPLVNAALPAPGPARSGEEDASAPT